MDLLNCNLKDPCLKGALSLTDVKNKVFPPSKLDRGPVLTEQKYTEKTLEGNWFERRAEYIPQSEDWKTTYDVNYIAHKNETWEECQDIKWDNKLQFEGLAREILLDRRKQYENNMTTTGDLSYNILPKRFQGPRIRTYHARQRKWMPEMDLTECFGSLTEFGLKEMMKEEIRRDSPEGIAKCRWLTTYENEIGRVKPIICPGQTVRFPKPIADLNAAQVKPLERKLPDADYCSFLLNVRH